MTLPEFKTSVTLLNHILEGLTVNVFAFSTEQKRLRFHKTKERSKKTFKEINSRKLGRNLDNRGLSGVKHLDALLTLLAF